MATTQAPSTTWNIDPAHTHAEFSVRHLMISTVKGRFGAIKGTVTGDASEPSSLVVDVTIDPATVDTREPQRDAHLRSADFFDVEKFPTLTFRSRRVEGDVDGEFKVVGDLTIHGVTREVTLDVSSEGRVTDPWGGERAGFSAKGKIDRRDFGLLYNQALETGGVVVGHEIKIGIDVELVKAA
jgi:polyisoprenoid-binding protein YceI